MLERHYSHVRVQHKAEKLAGDNNPKFGSCGSENGASTQNHFGF
jgi:hypothetical protein